MLLTKEQILSVEDLKKETMTVERWGGDIIVREATAQERDEYEQSLVYPEVDKDGKRTVKSDYRNAKARLVVKCVIDEDGNRLFSDRDADQLGKKSSVVIDLVFKRIRDLSGMTPEAEKALEKNSVDGEASSSSSPAT